MALRLLALLLLAGLALPSAALAVGTRRVAVLVAHPDGGPGTERLRYVARDAFKVADVLGELGGFAEHDLLMLMEPEPDALRAALAEAESRLAAARAAGQHTVLLFYYSGHAASGQLQMGDARLPMAELQATLRAASADVRLAFLDACQSGAITRIKGGRRAPSFVVDVEPERDARGYVVITSSSAHEASQESEELRGSFFTHHLVSGLRGAADRSGDAQVSLEEAYAYAYHRTVSQTAGTRGGTQHPTFTYDLRGNGAMPLTQLGGRGALLFPTAAEGRFLVYDRGRDLVVGEVGKIAGQPVRLSVAPGRYVIKQRTDAHLRLQSLEVRGNEQRTVALERFHAVAFEEDVTKGPTWVQDRWARKPGWSLGARMGFQRFFDAPSRAALFHPAPLAGVQLEGRNVVAPHLSLQLDAAIGGTQASVQAGPYSEPVPVDFMVAVGGVGLSWDWWLGDTRLQLGPRFSALYLRREFTDGAAPFQDLFTLSPGLAAALTWRVAAFTLGLEARAHYLRYATETDDRSLGFGEGYFTVGYAP
jgi:hypothetical protein